jgi:hypothetical protein
MRHARKDASEAGQLAGAMGSGYGREPLAMRLAPHLGLALAGNFLVDLRAVHGPSSCCPPDGGDSRFLPVLAPTLAIEDDPPVPKSHKVAFPGNPVEGSELRKNVTAGLDERAKIIEFLFDPKRNLAEVTIETEEDEDLSFQDVVELLGEVSPYQVGPINLDKIPE